MFAILVTWVALGDVRLMSTQQMPAQMCEAQAREVVHSDTVMAAVCVYDGVRIAEAIKVGSCRLYPEMTSDTLQMYYCNGRLPKWN